MLEIIHKSGPFGVLIVGLAILNLGLVGWNLLELSSSSSSRNPALGTRINAVLFWGLIGAVLGILGQANGIYLGLSAILEAPAINPALVAEGFALSFLTTIEGFLLLFLSALAWMALRS